MCGRVGESVGEQGSVWENRLVHVESRVVCGRAGESVDGRAG